MKYIFFIICICFFTSYSFSQMDNGNYVYKNSDFTLSFTIENGGWEISNIILLNNKTGKKEKGSGIWFKVNRNGADADYSGPDGWYQFQTSKCNFSFDEPTSKLILQQYECVTTSRDMSFTLTIVK